MSQIETKNPGILKVPAGKNVDDLPQSHFENLVDKIGYEKVIRALTNLEVWNKDKNKALSTWASNMADKLKKKFRSESNEKEDKIKKAKKELDDLYYQMARAGAAGIEPPQSMFDRKNELIKFLKANESIAKARIDIGKDDIDDAYMDVNYAISRDTNYTLKEFKKESMSTKQLVEAANRKCEMRWKVLAFNPDEDNKLVKEFKDFDCIDCAAAKKREYLEKNPTHVVEIISESKAQKNEDVILRQGKTLQGNPWTEAKVGEKTVNILGVNLKYDIIKFHVDMPEDKKTFTDKDRLEYKITNESEIDKLEKIIQTTICSKIGNADIGSTKQIGVNIQGYIKG